MKKIITLAMMMMVMTITANATRHLDINHPRSARISYNIAKNEALFLSDKMAYELGLTDAQYEAVYEINLDYLMSVNDRRDVYGSWWKRRNANLKYVLTAYQYEMYAKKAYLYRPLAWKGDGWTYNIYNHYANKSHFYKSAPKSFASYKGGKHKDYRTTWRNTSNNNHHVAQHTKGNKKGRPEGRR
jgi:hypothetical protein